MKSKELIHDLQDESGGVEPRYWPSVYPRTETYEEVNGKPMGTVIRLLNWRGITDSVLLAFPRKLYIVCTVANGYVIIVMLFV
jgi:hypothetical protein